MGSSTGAVMGNAIGLVGAVLGAMLLLVGYRLIKKG